MPAMADYEFGKLSPRFGVMEDVVKSNIRVYEVLDRSWSFRLRKRYNIDSCLQDVQNFEVASNAIKVAKIADRGPAADYVIGSDITSILSNLYYLDISRH